MGNKFKQQEENIKIARRAVKEARTDSDREKAMYNLHAAEEHLVNLKKSDKIASKNAKKYEKKNKKGKTRKRLGCLWKVLKICTLGLIAIGAKD